MSEEEQEERMGGEAIQPQAGSDVQADEAVCRALPLRVGIEATDAILAVLSTAGMNALPEPDGEPPRPTIVEVDAENIDEARQKIRDILGDVPIEPTE
jgi:hypothetical protein